MRGASRVGVQTAQYRIEGFPVHQPIQLQQPVIRRHPPRNQVVAESNLPTLLSAHLPYPSHADALDLQHSTRKFTGFAAVHPVW